MVERWMTKGLTLRGIKYGAIAGAIATWSLSSVIAAAEVSLAFPMGTFYSIMGISLGVNNATTAAYLGFGLHILTGTILGMIVGAIVVRMKAILNPYKSTLVGIGSGVVIWLVLFLPVTTLLIQPSIQRITLLIGASLNQKILQSSEMSQFVVMVSIGAIAFHLLWGAIFGFIMTSMIRIRARRVDHHVGMNV
jgi:hypothetical protein